MHTFAYDLLIKLLYVNIMISLYMRFAIASLCQPQNLDLLRAHVAAAAV